MICMAFMEIINFWLGYEPQVIEPVDVTAKQQAILTQFLLDEIDNWNCGEYEIFYGVKWQFVPGWLEKYPNIPLLANFSN